MVPFPMHSKTVVGERAIDTITTAMKRHFNYPTPLQQEKYL